MLKSKTRKTIAISLITILISISITTHLNTNTTVTAVPKNEIQDSNPNVINSKFFDNSIKLLLSIAHMSSLSTAIVKDDELIWAQGYGLYDREKQKEASDDTIYLVASISKTITVTALMQLYEQGFFDLDDDVNDYLPYMLRNPNHPGTKITFRMLLSHQSSIATDPSTYFRVVPGELEITGYPHPYISELLTPDGIHYSTHFWNDYAPGENMYYSNIGFGILGHLIEIISGQTVEDYCRQNIFTPLSMDDTSFHLLNIDLDRAAVPYEFEKREYIPYIHYNILEYPAGGLRTTVLDLSRFLIAHMNNGTFEDTQILTPDSIKEMQTIQYETDTYNFQYGLGYQIWETLAGTKLGHTGGLYGVATKMIFRESEDIGIIMFTNKEVQSPLEIIVFTLIEHLLFQKGRDL